MVSSRSVRAGKAHVELGLDDSPVKRKLRAFNHDMKALGAKLKGITTPAAIGVAAIGAAMTAASVAAVKITKEFAAIGDQLDKMSKRSGFSVETLSKLDFAASQSGASLEQMDRALAAMARFALQADRGLSTATDVLDRLGIEADEFNRLSPEEKFRTLAESIAKVPDPTKRAGLALAVFGRQGRELLPMLKDVNRLMDEAEKRGLIFTEEDAKKAAEFTDAMDVLGRELRQLKIDIGSELAPTLTALIEDDIVPAIDSISDWIDKNKELLGTLSDITKAMAEMSKEFAGIFGGKGAETATAIADTLNDWLAKIPGDPMGVLSDEVAKRAVENRRDRMMNDAMTQWFKDNETGMPDDDANVRGMLSIEGDPLGDLKRKLAEFNETVLDIKPKTWSNFTIGLRDAIDAAKEELSSGTTGGIEFVSKVFGVSEATLSAAVSTPSPSNAVAGFNAANVANQLGSSNPLLDEAKKQTQQGETTNKHLADIKRKDGLMIT